MQSAWKFATDFGDSAITIPVALMILGFPVWSRWRKVAIAWCLAIGGCGIVMGCLKLTLQALPACADLRSAIEPTNPSGHTAMSSAVYLSLAALVSSGMSERRRSFVVASALALVAAIASSRIASGFHSAFEVAIGLLVGVIAAGIFTWALISEPPRRFPRSWLWVLLLVAIFIALTHGTEWPVEQIVQKLAELVRSVEPACR